MQLNTEPIPTLTSTGSVDNLGQSGGVEGITMGTTNHRSNRRVQTNHQAPLYFKFTPFTGSEALQQIKNATNDFDEAFGIPQDFVDTLSSTLEPLELVQQGFLYAPRNPNVTRQVIGKAGCYFHLTTANCGIHFIWHDHKSSKFLFWGDKYPLIKAMKIITSRIRKYSE